MAKTNGYFRLLTDELGTKVELHGPKEGGSPISIKELTGYFARQKVPFDIKTINTELMNLGEGDRTVFLSDQAIMPVSESCSIVLSPDRMTAVARFYPCSTNGRVWIKEDILSELRVNKIAFGVDDAVIDSYLSDKKYCTDYVIANGKPTREGKDAVITYNFPTDNKIKPTLTEDGTVDFKNLNIVNHCKVGDILAVLTPEDRGEPGTDVCGNIIKPHDVKRLSLSFGRNIELSPDRLSIKSLVNGHVSYVDGKVFVSDVFEVENVDNSVGNITYDGNVKINGNVNSGFSVKANGNIEVKGSVEGAYIEAGGNIILSRGMNGMGKGQLKAGGNIVSKFLENCSVSAGGSVETDSILHSKVQAKTEINVMSKKGFITGGSVSATECIRVKTLGTNMGADTIVTVGIDPEVTNRYQELSKQVQDAQKNLKVLLPVIDATKKKLASGAKLLPEQIKNLQQTAATVKQLQEVLVNNAKEMETLKEQMDSAVNASVEVTGIVYPGTVITISDSSMIIRESFKYCRFQRKQGSVVMGPL